MTTMRPWWAGLVCGLGLCVAGPVWAGEHEHVTMEQLPAPVSKAVMKESKGSPILELEKATDGDKVTYEAEFRARNGRKVEIEVDESGKLVSKKVETPLSRKVDAPLNRKTAANSSQPSTK